MKLSIFKTTLKLPMRSVCCMGSNLQCSRSRHGASLPPIEGTSLNGTAAEAKKGAKPHGCGCSDGESKDAGKQSSG
jgi:hypothetical protein